MPSRILSDFPVDRAAIDALQVHHAQLSIDAWMVLCLWDSATHGHEELLCEAMQNLSATLRASPFQCACVPPGSGGDWCTGHCAQAHAEESA